MASITLRPDTESLGAIAGQSSPTTAKKARIKFTPYRNNTPVEELRRKQLELQSPDHLNAVMLLSSSINSEADRGNCKDIVLPYLQDIQDGAAKRICHKKKESLKSSTAEHHDAKHTPITVTTSNGPSDTSDSFSRLKPEKKHYLHLPYSRNSILDLYRWQCARKEKIRLMARRKRKENAQTDSGALIQIESDVNSHRESNVRTTQDRLPSTERADAIIQAPASRNLFIANTFGTHDTNVNRTNLVINGTFRRKDVKVTSVESSPAETPKPRSVKSPSFAMTTQPQYGTSCSYQLSAYKLSCTRNREKPKKLKSVALQREVYDGKLVTYSKALKPQPVSPLKVARVITYKPAIAAASNKGNSESGAKTGPQAGEVDRSDRETPVQAQTARESQNSQQNRAIDLPKYSVEDDCIQKVMATKKKQDISDVSLSDTPPCLKKLSSNFIPPEVLTAITTKSAIDGHKMNIADLRSKTLIETQGKPYGANLAEGIVPKDSAAFTSPTVNPRLHLENKKATRCISVSWSQKAEEPVVSPTISQSSPTKAPNIFVSPTSIGSHFRPLIISNNRTILLNEATVSNLTSSQPLPIANVQQGSTSYRRPVLISTSRPPSVETSSELYAGILSGSTTIFSSIGEQIIVNPPPTVATYVPSIATLLPAIGLTDLARSCVLLPVSNCPNATTSDAPGNPVPLFSTQIIQSSPSPNCAQSVQHSSVPLNSSEKVDQTIYHFPHGYSL